MRKHIAAPNPHILASREEGLSVDLIEQRLAAQAFHEARK